MRDKKKRKSLNKYKEVQSPLKRIIKINTLRDSCPPAERGNFMTLFRHRVLPADTISIDFSIHVYFKVPKINMGVSVLSMLK